MKIKKIKSIKVNCYTFSINWNKEHDGGSFSYGDLEIDIGTRDNNDQEILMIICHELMEICALEMNVRLKRPDCGTDYVFVYDHRQYETMMNMFAGLLAQFLV